MSRRKVSPTAPDDDARDMKYLWSLLDRPQDSSIDRDMVSRVEVLATASTVRGDIIDRVISDEPNHSRNRSFEYLLIRVCMAKDPFGTLKHLRDRLQEVPQGEKYSPLLIWILRIEKELARCAKLRNPEEANAEMLDLILQFSDVFFQYTHYLGISGGNYNVHHEGTAFEVTAHDASAIYPATRRINWALNELTDNVARERCGGNLPLIASKLKSTAAAFSFNRMLLRNSRQDGREPNTRIIIHYGDQTIDDILDSIHFLEGHDLPINNASYDPASQTLTLTVTETTVTP